MSDRVFWYRFDQSLLPEKEIFCDRFNFLILFRWNGKPRRASKTIIQLISMLDRQRGSPTSFSSRNRNWEDSARGKGRCSLGGCFS
ncbi:unnamed protein product [Victoria cruziana]